MLKHPLSLLLFMSLLGLEGYCLLMLWQNGKPGFAPGQAVLLIHFLTSMVAAWVLSRLYSDKYGSKSMIALFFFSVAFFMPILGLLGLLIAMIPGLREIKSTPQLSINYTRMRQFSDHQNLHEGQETVNLENLLYSNSPAKRLRAVYASLKLDDKNAIPLLRTALRDPVDDIRLLAYALIDRKEQQISERIELAKHNLGHATPKERLPIFRSIANDYWEIAHLGLAEGETLNYILGKTQFYLEQGLRCNPQDRGLHFLHGKLLLKMGKLQEAYDEFKIAEELGITKQKLLLYYAEIDFKLRRFPQVKQKMKENKFASERPEILASARFWLETPVG